MRVLIWIAEGTWERLVAQVREWLPVDADLTLLHVAPRDVEAVASGAHAGLLGRRPPRHAQREPPLAAISAQEAQSLLAAAQERLGRPARLLSARGRVEREVVAASADADLLVLARDGEPAAGPKSLGPRARFVVDHATCAVLLVARDKVAPVMPPPPPDHR